MKNESTLVLKFGGAAVANTENFATIASIIKARQREFNKLVVVVSAMGDTTDELISLAKKVCPNPPKRELDMLLSVGERISIALLAMALHQQGVVAQSFTGSQSGIITTNHHTDARITAIKPTRLLKCLDNSQIAIVAGFQGMSAAGDITTLGRGGSDTTAVALGVALQAVQVEFYKDVPGIFDANPKLFPNARKIDSMTFEEAIALTKNGAEVLQHRSVELAHRNGLPLWVRPFSKNAGFAQEGTWIGRGTKRGDSVHFESENAS